VDRSAAGRTAAWLLSCAPLALPALWAPAEDSLGDASRTALAALPWLAWIGMPRTFGVQDVSGVSSADSIGTAVLAAPPLAAAVGVALASLSMILFLGLAAGSRVPGPRQRLFAWAWIVLVPGLPLLRCALELGGAPAWGSAPKWLARFADASPIAWAWARASPVDVEPVGVENGLSIPWAGLAVCLVLLAIAGLPRKESGPELGVESQR